MNGIRIFISISFLFLFPFFGLAQDQELPRLGTFEVKRSTLPEMSSLWKRTSYDNITSPLKLPKISSKNYRTPVNMTDVIAGIESRKQAAKSQFSIDKIRVPFGANQLEADDRKGSLRLENTIHTETTPLMPYGTCIHGSTYSFCRICSPRSGFGNFGFGVYPHVRGGHFYYP